MNTNYYITNRIGGEVLEEFNNHKEAIAAARAGSLLSENEEDIYLIYERTERTRRRILVSIPTMTTQVKTYKETLTNLCYQGKLFKPDIKKVIERPKELPIATRKIQHLIEQGGEHVRDAKVILMPNGQECFADVFGKIIWMNHPSSQPSKE